MLQGTVCETGFHAFSNRRTERRLKRKKKNKKLLI